VRRRVLAIGCPLSGANVGKGPDTPHRIPDAQRASVVCIAGEGEGVLAGIQAMPR
jgi:hypothetical protein